MDGLPQLAHGVFLTDSGLETDLIFHHGYDLPSFAAFVLLEDEAGRNGCAGTTGSTPPSPGMWAWGSLLEAPTWRASVELRSGLQDVVRTWIRSPPRVTRGG